MSHKIPPHRMLLLLLLVGLVLAGCATAPPSPAAVPGLDRRDPAAVHQAWIAAIDGLQPEAAQALSDPTLPAPIGSIGTFRGYKAIPPGDTRLNRGTGALTGMELRDVRPSADGMDGYSLWRFERRDQCWQTQMRQTPDGNYVVYGFYLKGDVTECNTP